VNAEENISIVRRLFEEIYNAGNLDVIDEIYSPAFISHPNSVNHNGIQGKTGARQLGIMLRAAIPDIHFEILEQIAADDKVVTRWKITGTMRGEIFGFPPTGKFGFTTGISIHQISERRLIESWDEVDLLGAFDRFGIISTADENL